MPKSTRKSPASKSTRLKSERPRIPNHVMPAAVDSVFDVAFWFTDRALNDNEYLAPLKLQFLLFLAQAYFAVAHDGRKLAPATFVADEVGPIEPSVYRAWSKGRPNFEADLFLEEEVEEMLESIWSRFGHHSPDHLARLVRKNPAYRASFEYALRAEIPLKAMHHAFKKAHESPPVEKIVKQRFLHSPQQGAPVAVKAWRPRKVSPKK